MTIINIYANFDVLYYLSNEYNRFPDQTLFEISTMLYLSELLSVYDGYPSARWGYSFSRNKYGAPTSNEILDQVSLLCRQHYITEDDSGYYRIGPICSPISQIASSSMFSWRKKYIDTAIYATLTKPFPCVISAIQFEPGILSLQEREKTSMLLNRRLEKMLYEDFEILRKAIDDSTVDLTVPASIWINYLIALAK